MTHGEEIDVSWLIVFAPLLWPTVFIGIGYLIGQIVEWWRKR